MSKRKYLIKIYKTCIICDGKGKCDHVEVGAGNENIGSITKEKCWNCKGTGEEEITASNKGFEKLYIKTLQRRIGRLNLELSDVRGREEEILKEMKKYSKELDKIINHP